MTFGALPDRLRHGILGRGILGDTPSEYEGSALMSGWWEQAMAAPEIGAAAVVSVDGTDVAVVATPDGLIAFDDACTHRACPLSEGVIDGRTVVCPCHKSRFDLATGMPLNGPATDPIRIRRVEHDGARMRVER